MCTCICFVSGKREEERENRRRKKEEKESALKDAVSIAKNVFTLINNKITINGGIRLEDYQWWYLPGRLSTD